MSFIVYSIGKRECGKSYLEVLNSLNGFEKVIYELNKFDKSIYEIKHLDNLYGFNYDYYIPVDNLKKFFYESNYKYKNEIMKVLSDYISVYGNSDDFVDFAKKLDLRSSFLKMYSELKSSLIDYCEDYAIDNMSDDYKKQMIDLGQLRI